jgi:5-formyltetrahydrofolate cyclo-ligase
LNKTSLRHAARLLRDSLQAPEAASQLSAHLAAYLAARPPRIVAGYWPIGSEIDPRPALLALAARGAILALPETTAPGEALRLRLWTPGETLQLGRFGTSHPSGAIVAPDLVLVPLLAFDRSGQRLGYGGGYYDRTLAIEPRPYAIGCAYAAQERAGLPVEPHDIRLDAIATEAGMIEITNPLLHPPDFEG